MKAWCSIHLAVVLAWLAAPSCFAEVRTINLDFGNGGAYVGDDGVFSSPGGDFWNEVTVTPTIAERGVLGQANAGALLDEFGQPFNLGSGFLALPEVFSFAVAIDPITGSGAGPLSDGLTLLEGALILRELSVGTPVDVVVYFADPLNDDRPSRVTAAGGFGFDPDPGGVVESTGGTGLFPGQGPLPNGGGPTFTAIDHVVFTGLMPEGTTLGYPMLPGVAVATPIGGAIGIAHIAAIQIRGEFVFTPEPTAGTLLLIAASMATATRRRRV